MRPDVRVLSSLLLVLAVSGGNAGAQEPVAPPRTPLKQERPPGTVVRPSPVEKVGSGLFRVGRVVVNKNDRSITFPAQVNMDQGMLEYLIVHRTGKTHESLLNTTVEAYDLQIALLLLGFEGSETKLRGQGDPATPQGDGVRILIREKKAGADAEGFPAERWLVNRTKDETRDVGPMSWVYTGSMTFQGRFAAQESGSIVAIWHDPVAMIDNATPGGESNRIWFVKQGTVPPVGTAVDVTVVPAK